MSIILQSDLWELRKKENLDGKKIIFCSGTFDLTHAGHVLFFEDCKKQGDILVVGVGSDDLIRSYKGPNRPIVNEHARVKMIDSLKPVDYVFVQTVKTKENMVEDFLHFTFKNLKPDVYVINKDATDISIRDNLAKQYGVAMVVLDRVCPPEFNNISTTSLVDRIKNLF